MSCGNRIHVSINESINKATDQTANTLHCTCCSQVIIVEATG